MVFGRDFELEGRGASERSLELGGHSDKDGRSSARLYLLPNGDLTLYLVDSGYGVTMQIGEAVLEWRRWTTIAAADVPRLVGDATDPLEAARAAVVAKGQERNDASAIGGRLVRWLDERDVAYVFREFDYDG
ncbi:hypothetical protein AB0C87_33800 [Actinomadura sp. NPDC048021]|uniref:hypothetical protein n=1 Tax=Actinomadura sp. NPDC048021 TaxID=3155385 RepID=UPI0033CFA4D4